MKGAEEGGGGLVVAGGDRAPLLQAGPEVLDAMPAAVGGAVVGWGASVGGVRGHDGLGAGGADAVAPSVRRVAAVGDDALDAAKRAGSGQEDRGGGEFACLPRLAFGTPSGHAMRLTVGDGVRGAGAGGSASNDPCAPCGIDHINVMGDVDPLVMRAFLALIGFRFAFSVAVSSTLIAVWLRSSAYEHDIAYTRASRPGDRLHHVAFSVEDGNHYFRLSDRLIEHRLRWEFGPGRHNVGLGTAAGFGTNNYAYILDPGGNRNEFCAGLDQLPDDAQPRVVDIEPHQLWDVMNGWGTSIRTA